MTRTEIVRLKTTRNGCTIRLLTLLAAAVVAGCATLGNPPASEQENGVYATAQSNLTSLSEVITTWTAQLTHDAKERCLASCIATERLTALADEPSSAV